LIIGLVLTVLYAIISEIFRYFIAIWLTGVIENQTKTVEEMSQNQIKCIGSMNVISVTNSEITIVNEGHQTVSNIECIANDGTRIPLQTKTLASGQNISVIWNRGILTRIDCSGTCLSTVTLTSSCKLGDSCWK